MPVPVSRRAVLGGAAGLACLAGCAGPPPEELEPGPEVAVLLGAIRDEERLIALYEQVTAAYSGLSSAFADALRDHREHLEVLRRHYVPGSGGATATPSLPPVPAAQPSPPSSAAAAVPALRAAEKAAAAARAADTAGAPAGLAQLLASIGACEAGHATALGLA